MLLTIMCALSCLACLWFALSCEQFISNSSVMLYLSCVFGGLFINGTVPLFYELAVETTFPIAEGVTTGLLTLMNNIGTLLFLIFPEFPGIGLLFRSLA